MVTECCVAGDFSIENCDMLVTEDGTYRRRYVYDENGIRILRSTAWPERPWRSEFGIYKQRADTTE